jgi:uncharacterized protein YukE
LDYFWLLALVSAGFGAVLTGVVLRRLDISRMSYGEAKQMLSAMIGSLSKRIEESERLLRELSEQVQVLSANQTRVGMEAQTSEKERLLSLMQDWIGNAKGFVEKMDGLQKNLKSVEQEVEEIRARIDQASVPGLQNAGGAPAPVGVVTEDTLARLSPTEKDVLELLVGGSKGAPEIGRVISKSREHTARLMKSLFEQGFVEREVNRQPYEYRLNDKVRGVLVRVGGQETTQPAR